nr:transglutaminase-like domain-containing protein [Sulfoacidibacillus ferrooxidans]
MDDNVNPPYQTIADALIENSPTLNTGIEAISNYVSDLVVYDFNELNANQYVWQDAGTTFTNQSGVCENYAQLTASMLRLVGIPAQTIGGYGDATWTTPNYSDTNPQDAHEWVEAWNGSEWVMLDPTWADGNQSVNNLLTNQYFTNTVSFSETHAAQADQIGTDFSAYGRKNSLYSKSHNYDPLF